jgi:D-3-phosphoglycerate dehydrogenase
MGQIGNRVADLLKSMGVEVSAYDPLTKSKRPDVIFLPFEELLSIADVISFHCPLTDDTRNMINMENTHVIKEGAYLVNTARGGVVAPDALISALKNGKLKGAALDVYSSEPPDFQNELFRMDNVITCPHIAAMSYGSQIGMAKGAAEEIRRVLKLKERPLHPVLSMSHRIKI